MLTTFNSDSLTLKRDRYLQISGLLLNHIKLHHKDVFKQNQKFKILHNKRTQNNLHNLKKDFQAKQLTLEYFSSFQLISDILISKINADCLEEIQEVCNYLQS